jgi:glycine cleavage system H lipoate-binding protein
MITREQDNASSELCLSSAYINCAALKQHHEDRPVEARCPFLQESLMQYCSAAEVTKYIPYSEASVTRCGTDNHRYCDVYSISAPNGDGPADGSADAVDGIAMPSNLSFAANHLWLDVAHDGRCHIGADAFLAKLLPAIDAVHFPMSHGTILPTAVLTVHGVDLNLVFPSMVAVTGTNSYLRVNPDRIKTEPYNSGWLFEGALPSGSSDTIPASPETPFYKGRAAQTWMRAEVRRLSSFVQDQIIANRSTVPGVVLNDGGVLQEGFVSQLNRQEIMTLFNEFFSPNASRRSSSC